MIIPIQVNNEGALSLALTSKVEELTLKELKTKEAHLEEFVRNNIGLLFTNDDNADEETLLVVGQQVVNEQKGRSDLVAVDGDGNLVLIELKRDITDITAKKEAVEFQAIRYAANLAGINSPEDLERRLFEPYVGKNFSKFSGKYPGLTALEVAHRVLGEFLLENKADKDFNRRQRIVLIASDFDAQTKSACAWLAKNGIDIRCISLKPIKYSQQYFLSVKQIIPPPALEGFFVEVAGASQASNKQSVGKSQNEKQSLPQMAQLLQWGLIAEGDFLYIKKQPSEVATVKDDKQVTYQGQDMTYNAWGQKVTGWSAINIYENTFVEKAKKTLDALRREKVQEIEQADSK